MQWPVVARGSEETRQLRIVSGITRRTFVLSAGAFALVGIAAPRWSAPVDALAQTASAKLFDLHDVSELRTRFNADAGFTRLVLLVSPT